MILRPATSRDAAAICAITNQIIRDTLVTFTTTQRTVADISGDIAERGPCFLVAEQGSQIVGFATFGPFRPGPGYAFVREHTIQLAQAARGRGVGRALMQSLEQQARARDIHALVAGISGANTGAITFHARLGFRKVGQLPKVGFKNGQWLDLILMQKMLVAQPGATADTGVGHG